MRKFTAILSAAALIGTSLAAGITTAQFNTETVKAAETVTLGNNGYPAGSIFYDEEYNKLAVFRIFVESGTANSYQWQVSSDGTNFNNIEGATSSRYELELDDETEENYFRCVVNGNIISEPLQMLDAYNNNFTKCDDQWYFTNGKVAYTTEDEDNERYFDIVGRYEYTNPESGEENIAWLQTSYSGYWSLHSGTDPEACVEDYKSSTVAFDDFYIGFDKDNNQAILVTADLAEDQTCFAISADTQLGDSDLFGDYADDAALKVVLNSDSTLKAINMISAKTVATAQDTDGAFVLAPVTPASTFYAGYYYDIDIYGYNELKEDYNSNKAYVVDYIVWDWEYESRDELKEVIEEDMEETYGTVEEAVLAYYQYYDGFTSTNMKDFTLEYYKDELDESYDKESDEAFDELNRFFYQHYNGGIVEYKEIAGKKIGTLMEEIDSGVSVGWTNLTPGSVVQFTFAAGSVADTGAMDIIEEEQQREEEENNKSYTSGGSTMTAADIKETLEEDEVVIKEDSALEKAGITDIATAIKALDDEEKVTELVESALDVGNVKVEVVADEDKLPATLDTTDVSVISAVLNPVDLIKALAGEDIIITLTVEKNSTAVSELGTVGEKIKALVTADEEAMFFDVDLTVQVGDSAPVVVSELGGTLKISVAIPESLRAEGRTYGIILSHVDAEGNVTAEVVDNVVVNGNVITYSVDKLCLMAITYKDKAAENNNNNSNKNEDVETGTSNWMWLGLFGPAMMAALVVLDLRRKKEEA